MVERKSWITQRIFLLSFHILLNLFKLLRLIFCLMIFILSILKEFSLSELFDLIICLIKLSLLNLFWNLGFFLKELSYFTFQYFQSFFPLFFKLCLLLFFFFPSLIHFLQNLLFYLQFYHFNLLLLRIF